MIATLLSEAWQAMLSNRLRTFLTALGITIGVAAVVLMVSIGQGTQQKVIGSINSMGANLLIVNSASSRSGGVRSGMGGIPTLTLGDVAAIRELPPTLYASPISTGFVQLVYGPNNWNSYALGVNAEYLELRDWEIEQGRGLSESDINSATRVAVLGQKVVDNLFGDEDPIGQVVRVKNLPFTVIGVLSKKGQSMDGRDQDDSIIVPITTAQRQLLGGPFRSSVSMIMVKAENAEGLNALERQISALLRQRHHIRENAENDFGVTNMTSVAETASEVTGMLSLLLGAIASISLFVGGIGIMNIMLVSVTERTREIGIRMAIGADRRTILTQFLLESIIITVTGGVIGILIGVGLAQVVGQVAAIPVSITAQPIVLAFGVSVAVGVFFGLYPARKASLLRPIEALRYQ
ncbi:MAG: ABC transporter permease [Nitrosomonadales bacterium]|nr:ABC transporter permease [Nitrosomonadales bacterium]